MKVSVVWLFTLDSIFNEIGKKLADDMEENVVFGLNAGKSSDEILRENIKSLASWCENNKPLMLQVLTSGICRPSMSSMATLNRKQMAEVLERIMFAGQKKGEIPENIDVADAVLVIMGAYFIILYDWADGTVNGSLMERMNHCLDLILSGICTGTDK